MIEELEAEAVSQMVNEEQRKARSRITFEHEGVDVEVRARRRRDGAAVLNYSFDGVRLERAVLLMLICPEVTCERSQLVRRQWAARNPPTPVLQRRPRTGLKTDVQRLEARLLEEAPVRCAKGLCVARPASFAVLSACPMNAHSPVVLRMEGWDVFKDGEYLAGGLTVDSASQARRPTFPTLDAVATWANQADEAVPVWKA